MMTNGRILIVLITLLVIGTAEGFTVIVKSPFAAAAFTHTREQPRHPPHSSSISIQLWASTDTSSSSSSNSESSSSSSSSPLDKFSKTTTSTTGGLRRARDLVLSLVQDEKCYTTESGAAAFAQVCAANVIIEDCFFPQPFNGKTEATQYMLQRVEQRKRNGKANADAAIRIDRITDGDLACGFAWTWTCGQEEGLRGTTFVQLNNAGEIAYLQEIPEPIWKPGNFTKDLLKAILKNAQPSPALPFDQKSPTIANELARYIFQDLQYADRSLANDEFMRFIDDDIIYRDFNYENALRGPGEVRQFLNDFTFPGIEFFPVLFDDGMFDAE
jgi:hypothetical protein